MERVVLRGENGQNGVESPEDEEIIEETQKEAKRGLKWDLSPFDLRKYSIILSSNSSFRNVFDSRNNMTKEIIQEIERRCVGENHLITTISGGTGTGKSTVACWFAKEIERVNSVKFPEDSSGIQFTFEQLLEHVRLSLKNTTAIADESVLKTGQGSKREQIEIMNMENTVRKHGQNIIWVYPVENIKHGSAHLNLKTIAVNRKLEITKCAVMFNEIYMGYIIIPVGKIIHSNLWKLYNERKDDFIEAIRSRNVEGKDYFKLANEIMRYISIHDFKSCENTRSTLLILRKIKNLPMMTEPELKTVAGYLMQLKKRFL